MLKSGSRPYYGKLSADGTTDCEALAFEHILNNIPITIRDNELIVGVHQKRKELSGVP